MEGLQREKRTTRLAGRGGGSGGGGGKGKLGDIKS